MEIKRDAVLVAVEIGNERHRPLTVVGVEEGCFDLDDLCAVVGKLTCAVRPSPDACEVEDSHALEWEDGLGPLTPALSLRERGFRWIPAFAGMRGG